MAKILIEDLIKEKFLILDNALMLSENIKTHLKQLAKINEFDVLKFQFDFEHAGSNKVLEKIAPYNNIVVSTTFTTIKSHNVEDLIYSALKHNIKNKNVLSLLQFEIVGSDFEYYKDEVNELAKNNVHFYFLSKDYNSFEIYK